MSNESSVLNLVTIVEEGLRRRRWASPSSGDLAQILILPAFSNPQAWDVQAVANFFLTDVQVTRTTWRIDLEPCLELDEGSTKVWEPRIEVVKAPLDKERTLEFLSRFAAISFPPFKPNEDSFRDGQVFEMAIGEALYGARVYWHCEMPKEWAEFKKVFDEFFFFLKSAIDT